MRKHLSLACALAVAGSLLITSPASAAPRSTPNRSEMPSLWTGIRAHLAALEAIAKENLFEGVPTRATGTDGHEESVGYVVEHHAGGGFQRLIAGIRGRHFRRAAPAAFQQMQPNAIIYPVTTVRKAFGTRLTSPATATSPRRQWSSTSPSRPRRRAPLFRLRGKRLTVPKSTGKIVLLQRGTCDFGLKAETPPQKELPAP